MAPRIRPPAGLTFHSVRAGSNPTDWSSSSPPHHFCSHHTTDAHSVLSLGIRLVVLLNVFWKHYHQKFKTDIQSDWELFSASHKSLGRGIEHNTQLENGTRRAQIPRKPLIFPSPNKQTNRQTKNFGHTEVRTLDRRIFSTRLLPTELLTPTSVITLIRLLLSDYYYPGYDWNPDPIRISG